MTRALQDRDPRTHLEDRERTASPKPCAFFAFWLQRDCVTSHPSSRSASSLCAKRSLTRFSVCREGPAPGSDSAGGGGQQDLQGHLHLQGIDPPAGLPYSEIDCVINDEYKVACRREGTEVYLPFSFVSKYFEVRASPW